MVPLLLAIGFLQLWLALIYWELHCFARGFRWAVSHRIVMAPRASLVEVASHNLPDGWNDDYSAAYIVFRRAEFNEREGRPV